MLISKLWLIQKNFKIIKMCTCTDVHGCIYYWGCVDKEWCAFHGLGLGVCFWVSWFSLGMLCITWRRQRCMRKRLHSRGYGCPQRWRWTAHSPGSDSWVSRTSREVYLSLGRTRTAEGGRWPSLSAAHRWYRSQSPTVVHTHQPVEN